MDFAFGALTTEEFNTERYVDGFEGAAAVQSVLDDVAPDATPDNQPKVIVYGDGEAEWRESVEVPNNTILESVDTFSVRIPDDHALGTKTANGGTWPFVIANADFSGSAEGVEIRNFTVDFAGDPANGSSKDQQQNAAPIWLHQCTGGAIVGCEGKNVLPAIDAYAGDNPRPYGVQLSESPNSLMRDCVGRNCGYEGIALRGDNSGSEVVRCYGHANQVHSMQIARFTGDGVDSSLSGDPKGVTVRGCGGDDRFTIHGGVGYEGRDIVIDQPTFSANGVRIIGACTNIAVRNPHCQVQIRAADIVTGITIDGSNYAGGTSVMVRNEKTGGEFDNIHLLNIHKRDNNTILEVEDYSGTSGIFGHITMENCSARNTTTSGFTTVKAGADPARLTIRGSYANTSELVRVQGSNSHLELLTTQDSDLSDVGTVAAEAGGGTFGAVTTDGKGEAALGGVAPDATQWPEGTTVEDTDNPGTLYYVYDNSVSGGATAI